MERFQLSALVITLILLPGIQAPGFSQYPPPDVIPADADETSGGDEWNRQYNLLLAPGISIPLKPDWFSDGLKTAFRGSVGGGIEWIPRPATTMARFEMQVVFSYVQYAADLGYIPTPPGGITLPVTAVGGDASCWHVSLVGKAGPHWPERRFLPYLMFWLGVGRFVKDDRVLEWPAVTYTYLGFKEKLFTIGSGLGADILISPRVSAFVDADIAFLFASTDEERYSEWVTQPAPPEENEDTISLELRMGLRFQLATSE